MSSKDDWSQWLDFEENTIKSVPEGAGVFVMHAAMKILFIGGGTNLRKTLLESISKPCLEKAKRFRYQSTSSYEQVKENLIKEYIAKHNGKLPLCMGETNI